MKSIYSSALLVMMVFVTGADGGGLTSLVPLYSTANIWSLLNDEKVKHELKITKQQETAINPIVAKNYQKLAQDTEKLVRMSGSDKEAKIRALHMARADELLQSLGQTLTPRQVKRLKQILLQQWGIVLFDHPEIRDALQLSDGQVTALKALNEKIRQDIIKQAMGGRMTREQAHKLATALSHGVPDGVRAALTKEQRQKLQDLLGEPYVSQ